MGDAAFEKFIDSMNEKIFKDKNFFFNRTTIEGVLINEDSYEYFVKWLVFEIFNGLKVVNRDNILFQIDALRKKKIDSLEGVIDSIDSLFSHEESSINLDRERKKFIINLKKEYVRLMEIEMDSIFTSAYQKMIAMRLIFKGKTETLVSMENKNLSFIDDGFVANIRSLQEKLAPLKFLTDKTSGWITRFINFSLNEIEKEQENSSFEVIFSRKFPEFHDIIQRLQSR